VLDRVEGQENTCISMCPESGVHMHAIRSCVAIHNIYIYIYIHVDLLLFYVDAQCHFNWMLTQAPQGRAPDP
jgi:hypothetical protein